MTETFNSLGSQLRPFFFTINYNKNQYYILYADEQTDKMAFNINGISSRYQPTLKTKPKITSIEAPNFTQYQAKLFQVQQHIKQGDVYLANLTTKSKITLNCDLQDCYAHSFAKYKLYKQDSFVSFSPEQFIKIHNNQIETFPMKGTATKDKLNELLCNEKEIAEHTMCVDLLRNDISQIATNVRLKKFREPSQIANRQIWQTSSHICGNLQNNWQTKLGNILDKLLPAGSISGTPKKKTVEILTNIEDYQRGFYTGIFGYFGGDFLDSAVAIRFIEQQNSELYYKSGGGVTIDSNPQSEYDEILAKIYIPLH